MNGILLECERQTKVDFDASKHSSLCDKEISFRCHRDVILGEWISVRVDVLCSRKCPCGDSAGMNSSLSVNGMKATPYHVRAEGSVNNVINKEFQKRRSNECKRK